MKYISIPQSAIQWIQLHPEIRNEISAGLPKLLRNRALYESIIVAGPLRIAATKSSSTLVLWNVDYATSLEVEQWAVFRADKPLGLLVDEIHLADIFERELNVASQRLQLLNLPEQFIHRYHRDGVHTCVAGGNTAIRKRSIAYYEGTIPVSESTRNIVYLVGPNDEVKNLEASLDRFVDFIKTDLKSMDQVVSDSEQLMIQARMRPALDSRNLPAIGAHLLQRDSTQNHDSLAATSRLVRQVDLEQAFEAEDYTYDDWMSADSPLATEQRQIIESNLISKRPVRILGPAGSGKTLLMQLLAINTLRRLKSEGLSGNILYITHNATMASSVATRFRKLGAEEFMLGGLEQNLIVMTLFEYSRDALGGEDVAVIDKDAQDTKDYQWAVVLTSLEKLVKDASVTPATAPLISQFAANKQLLGILARLVVSEIAIAIKGHHLTHDQRRYVDSEKPLSRLHSALNKTERQIVFSAFEEYHAEVFEGLGVLDADDLAITLMGKLKTPLWEMRRRSEGVDFLFVDEAQLFNENECRIFALLTKPPAPNLPVALALDDAQELNGLSVSGLARLGIEGFSDQTLTMVHRSTESIMKLAFHLIHQTTDLFSVDFPDFSKSFSLISDDDPRARKPELRQGGAGNQLGAYVVKQVKSMRSGSVRSVAVVVFGDQYWDDVVKKLIESDLRVVELKRRGEPVPGSGPITVVTRPELIGGQEFDAVVVVGLENGIVPQKVESHAGFNATLEQQALRSMYLVFTRARYRLSVVVSVLAKPSLLLKSAIDGGLLVKT